MKNLIKKKIPELTTTGVLILTGIVYGVQDFTPSPDSKELALHKKNVELEKKYKTTLLEKREVEKKYKEYKSLADLNFCQMEYQENKIKRDKLISDFKNQNPTEKMTEPILIELVDKGIKLYPKSKRCKHVSISHLKKDMDELEKRYSAFEKHTQNWRKKLEKKKKELQDIRVVRDQALKNFVKFKRDQHAK